jgi:hypothetical protein
MHGATFELQFTENTLNYFKGSFGYSKTSPGIIPTDETFKI